ncbi:lipase 3-like [Toxorhynchites rutilus septentrionalis]|uniref:lipase 3-like n=1 Tax=Toxorhynchites rutilus septentrionalis TaxID=329112 RepID=UPI002479ACD9|nr:lipase 3-like [Toxorhynchites rutilus septentrionalis]
MRRSEWTNVVTLLLLSVIALISSTRAASVGKGNLKSTEHYIVNNRINSERYRVTTEDGYRLTVFRLVTKAPSRGVALLQHGMRSSSADWLQLNSNLPSQLLAAGFEVWVGNSRGSPESAGHNNLRNTSADFWDFSFHEIGYYDLAAMIDAALEKSHHKRIHLIGYSEGSTAALVLLSERPSYGAKIASINLIAPAAFMANSQLKGVAQLYGKIERFFPWAAQSLNANGLIGNSRKALDHYRQLILSGRFQKYDYGPPMNLQRYGTQQVPDYDLSRITLPMALHFGELDPTVHPVDVRKLGQRLGRTTKVQLIPYPSFKHYDFISRREATSIVYPLIVKIVSK